MVQASMSLKITRYDAQCMSNACMALKRSLRSLQKREHETTDSRNKEADPPVPQRVVSTSDTESVESREESTLSSSKSLHALLVEAAEMCDDDVVTFFVRELKRQEFTRDEIQTSLLIFLDAEKTPKTLSAFRFLSSQGTEDNTENQSEEPKLNRKGIISLFRSLLTSVTLCIHDNKIGPNNQQDTKHENRVRNSDHISPSKSMDPPSPPRKAEEGSLSMIKNKLPSFGVNLDQQVSQWSFSENMVSNIVEVATFAADHLYEYIRDKRQGSMVSFRDFEEWYKAGGYSVVQWLELLHPGKWSEVGCGTVSAENSPSKHDRKVKVEACVEEGPMDKKQSPVQPSTKKQRLADVEQKMEMPNFFMVDDSSSHSLQTSKTLVTFDFTGANLRKDGTIQNGHVPFCINITEDNLVTLKNLVTRTELSSRLPADLTKVLMAHSRKEVVNGRTVDAIHKDDFGKCIRELVPATAARSFSQTEMQSFSICFTNFFSCFENGHEGLGADMADVKEFAIGFSLLCAGNKSSKLVNGFELLDEGHRGFLTEVELTSYIRSYLAMLIGISLLSGTIEKSESISETQKREMLRAVDDGAKWTLAHFLEEHAFHDDTSKEGKFTFRAFARWYTNGGFKFAPWLELLDLRKLLSLLPDMSLKKEVQSSSHRSSSRIFSPGRRNAHADFAPAPPSEVLFTFPLAKDCSLVVLREDATYVRSVVEKLHLLTLGPDEVWNGLYSRVKQRPPVVPIPWSRSHHRKPGKGKSMDVDQHTFVQCMEDLLTSKGRKHSPIAAKETLENFFQSFDLDQIDRVALNQLMGGLSLLCGGKKSTKLAFSFGLFDSRKDSQSSAKHPSLDVDDLFIFLRSFLIVMFSCCRQSLDLSADCVGRYIADTSHMVADDVMRFQWHARTKNRIDFDEFGEWYNEGGFETAPWLELLDLNKWVLLDTLDTVDHHRPSNSLSSALVATPRSSGRGDYCPSPPPEDAVDQSFFADDEMAMMPLDSMDEMDLILMQQPSHDKENDGFALGKESVHFSMTPSPRGGRGSSSNALKFHLVSSEDTGGYMVSVSQKRVRHLRHVLVESGIFDIGTEFACQKILAHASKDRRLKKDEFDAAMRQIAVGYEKDRMSIETQRVFFDLLMFMFDSFDRDKSGRVRATELACGLTVLCNGKKSDKLEYAFEMLDVTRRGRLSRTEVTSYLRSFLTALLCVTTSSHLHSNPSEDTVFYMNGKPCEHDAAAVIRAADAGSSWASVQAFRGCYSGQTKSDHLNFDDFADWYTRKGYSCIPWLELLDLRKWVITE